MSEENKSIRLSKISKDFNVGVSTLVEYLAKKGKVIDNNPNTKVDAEIYDILSAAFQSEKKVKEEASKLTFVAPKPEKIKIEVKQEHIKEDAIEDIVVEKPIEEVIIKTKTIEYKEETSETKKEELPQKNEVKKEKEKNVASTPIIEKEKEKKQEQKEEEEEKQEISQKENQIKTTEQEVLEENKEEKKNKKEEKKDGDEVLSFNIVGKIDLSAINSKVKPDRKTKQEKKTEKDEKRKLSKEAAFKQKNKKEDDAFKKKDTYNKDNSTSFAEGKDNKKDEKPINASAPTKEATETNKDNFIETQYTKLTGPKVLDQKIDLSQFNKPKKQSSSQNGENNQNKDKKKRKRIKQPSNNNNSQQGNAPSSQGNKNRNKKDDKKGDFHNKKKVIKKVEVNSEEIEKHIKETLARLSPLGKSKTSKHRREKRQTISQQHKQEFEQEIENQKILKVTEFVTANELATMMNVPVTKIIASCMSLGMFVSINQRIDAEAIQLIAEEFGYQVEFVGAEVIEALENTEEEDRLEDLVPRAPIVTVMGHVDHGKTSLLDFIRKTNVIAGEAGGITQHIGAYEVELKNNRKITFLDTPGHEAFTAMRARGAKLTDMAIIVIATDDRVMPQTIEAINHAQAAGVPIIFALNKIDAPGSDPEKIKAELANMNILVEDWGGKYQSQEISAKKGINITELLEKVLLEADILDLKGNPSKRAKGTVIESSLDKGRGYIAKLLVQDGTIRQGDFLLAGSAFGRVKAMYNERNQLIKEAGPSTPLLVLGLNEAPQAGDNFNVMSSEKEAKDLANRRIQLKREQSLRTKKHITLDEIGRRIAIGDFKQLDLIVKADVDGSVEALSDSLLKLSTPEVQVNVIHKSVGQITESDVLLATASNAIIIGFQVRPSVGARKLAEAEQIDIRLYSIIYTAINELKDAIEGMLSPEIEEKIVANLEIREVFKISKVGSIAGCFCLDGKINRNTKVRIIRDGIVVYTGKLASLKRFKDEVKEVVAGQECGLNIENFNDIKVGDIVEGYDEIEVKRHL
ncbi:MAG: translation initiation factor IF-2 [Bacteroidales bacterium]|jgi:translation initiation factor IF-2|nr:translation initiation factor IF-2 [Bacteroidales bacterium]